MEFKCWINIILPFPWFLWLMLVTEFPDFLLPDPWGMFINEPSPFELPGISLFDDPLLILLQRLLTAFLDSMYPMENLDCFEYDSLMAFFWFWLLYLVNCLEAFLYNLRNLMILMIRTSFVPWAPIFEALEALATLVTVTAFCMALLYPVNSYLIHLRSTIMVAVESISSQK